jgi:hypothetical protein
LPAGIAGAAVTLTGPGKNEHLVTGDDGLFRFDQLPPGKYNVAVEKEGYVLQVGPASLDVRAGMCAFAAENLVVNRRMVGKLTGADGLPAANIQVEFVPRRPTEQYSIPYPVAQTKTGSDGAYELRNVRAGEYYLGINLVRTPSKEMPYTRYFYPGTEDPSAAVTVIVPEGPGTTKYHFPIPAPQKQRQVEGFVYWPDGRPGSNVRIVLEDVRWPWQTHTISGTTDAKGHVAISAFDGTAYRIHAVTMANFTNQASSGELTNKGLDQWRAGRGF